VAPTNQLPTTSNQLPVMEHFYTLQGEGKWSGNAAYFIRLGGCDVGCTWCDVKESWDKEKHPNFSIDEINSWVVNTGTQIAVITGGEPTMHDLKELTTSLKTAEIRTHIETSGTNPLTGNWDWITFSPKRFKKPLEEYFENSHELKIIIAHKNDLRWALELGEKMNPKALLYIQPEWDTRKEMETLCIDFIKENPKWKLSIQTHKYLGID
jgi:7-carboxy-7-deazaguanine synthase